MVNLLMPEASPITVAGRSEKPLATPALPNPTIDVRDLTFAYGNHEVLHEVSLQIPARAVTAFIGPSGCGKTTLLRCFNRMNDLVDSARIIRGSIEIEACDINDPAVDVVDLRRRIGMVFQKSNPFPKSIFDNIAYGLRIAGVKRPAASTRWSSARCAGARFGMK